MAGCFFNWRFWLWLSAVGLLTAALFKPTWTVPVAVHRYLVVVDITQSMNARDYHLPDLPPDRFSFSKAAIEHAILDLPCGSEIALGFFTNKNTQLLLQPVEICRHGPALRDALRAIDWRSAWAADSHIAYGLFNALRLARRLNTDLVFVTDGDQIPTTTREPHFADRPGRTGGWIVGAGSAHPVPIPRLDLNNQMKGYWHTTDLPRSVESSRYRTEAPARKAGLLLTHLDETRLRRLAGITGLDYLRLETPKQLATALKRSPSERIQPTELDLSPWLGAGALLVILLTVLV